MAGPSLEGLLNPAMLRWAREQSRIELVDAARSASQTPARLDEWETGAHTPTLNQLRGLANTYKRSVGVFFLREIPQVPRRPRDFRRVELSANGKLSPKAANGIRECEAKRDAALDIHLELETEPPQWTLELPTRTPPERAAEVINEALGITMQDRRRWSNVYDALNGWKSAVEALGALVFQVSGVPVEEMRGCSISLRPLPIIVLNSADSPLGRIFTLLHEVTHIARGESSICDMTDETQARAIAQVEQYCNHVAGAVLVPRNELLSFEDVRQADEGTEWSNERLLILRRHFWASRETVLRRLLITGKTSQTFYRVMREDFERQYQDLQEAQSSTAIVPPYRRVILSNGRALTRLALLAYNSQAITGSELSRILNTKLDHLPAIRNALSREVVA
jgi:Zn-dependent peptidase ImmA (M78 family)